MHFPIRDYITAIKLWKKNHEIIDEEFSFHLGCMGLIIMLVGALFFVISYLLLFLGVWFGGLLLIVGGVVFSFRRGRCWYCHSYRGLTISAIFLEVNDLINAQFLLL